MTTQVRPATTAEQMSAIQRQRHQLSQALALGIAELVTKAVQLGADEPLILEGLMNGLCRTIAAMPDKKVRDANVRNLKSKLPQITEHYVRQFAMQSGEYRAEAAKASILIPGRDF